MSGDEPIITENTPILKWEKRIAIWLITAAMLAATSFIFNIKSIVDVMKNDIKHAVSTLTEQKETIKQHDVELRDHEKRIVKLEVVTKSDEK